MKYLVNSNLNFAKHSLRILIPSMIKCGISPNDILVVIGGCDENYKNFKFCGMYNYLKVRPNSIDQNCFYAIKKNPNIFDQEYYYFMHDTTSVGKNFKQLTENILNFMKNNGLNTVKNSTGYSGNMGFYKKEFILRALNECEIYLKHEESLLDENLDIEIKKKISFELEDKIFSYDFEISKINSTKFQGLSKFASIYNQKFDVYDTKNERVVFYYDQLDLYKYSANTWINDTSPLNTFLGCKI